MILEQQNNYHFILQMLESHLSAITTHDDLLLIQIKWY